MSVSKEDKTKSRENAGSNRLLKDLHSDTSEILRTLKEQSLDQNLRFSESILLTRWDLGKWVEDKLRTYITVSGFFVAVLGYSLTSPALNADKVFLGLGSISLVAVLCSMIVSLRGITSPSWFAHIQKRKDEYLPKSLRTTRGIHEHSFKDYLDRMKTITVEGMIEQNVNHLMVINDIIMDQLKAVRRSSILISVSGLFLSLAFVIGVLRHF